jgi:hypothetical protein
MKDHQKYIVLQLHVISIEKIKIFSHEDKLKVKNKNLNRVLRKLLVFLKQEIWIGPVVNIETALLK